MPQATTGLARVTISAPYRRVDVALPEGVFIADLLPDLLRHAGDGMADGGEAHGGWILRRGDGAVLDSSSTLVAQGVRDGAVLHLIPATASWPELEYDDVVETIAEGARRSGAGWTASATRATGLVAAGVAATCGLAACWLAGPGWRPPAVCALVLSVVLVACGGLASRAFGDALVGSAIAAYALPYAFVGGVLVLAPSDAFSSHGGGEGNASLLLVGSCALLLAGMISVVCVGNALWVFVCACAMGVLGICGALLAYVIPAAGVAAIVLTVIVTGAAAMPLLAIRLGGMPMPSPVLPPDLAETGRSIDRQPDRTRVFAAVTRTDELLTGMLLAVALTAVIACGIVALRGGVAGTILAGVAATALLLRARLFATRRQRLPLLCAGVTGWAVLAAGALSSGGAAGDLASAVALAVLAVVVSGASTRYATRAPSPYLGRAADVLDALCVVSMVPCACAVLGLYGLARGIVG